ncbi:hypothetical protein ACEWY4_013260 [Coilia grayii]|uniref:Ig-like domain-containing protein n=1 Tax=Coilia grayii TaxID=363190 RepID=A0ABD1JVV4_9TELE
MTLMKYIQHFTTFSFLFIYLQLSGAVEEKHCLTGEAVTLGCHVSVPQSAQLTDIEVCWQFKRRIRVHQTEGNKLFEFVAGNITKYLPGYAVDLDALLKGNASLHLANPAVADDGEFTCAILVKRVEKYVMHKVSLHVSALPSLSLTDHATVLDGEKTTVVCDITGFYPEQLEVEWLRRRGNQNVSVEADICTRSPSPNPDHTYSLRSQITIQGNRTLNHGTVYICQVKHRSLSEPQSRAVQLSVLERPQNPVTIIAPAVAACVLIVLLIAGAAWIVYRYFHTVPPSVSDICSPSVIYANTRADMKCTVRRVKPKHVDVQWYRVLPHGAGTDAPSGQAQEKEPLCTEKLTKDSQLHSENTQLLSTLSLSPKVSDDGGRYRCVVAYKGHTYIKETTLSIKTQPSFLQISSVPQVPVLGQRLLLCCRVERFYPAQVRLEWLGPGGEMLGPVVQYGPFPDYQGLHSVWSTSQLTVTAVEDGLVYRCRVYHSSFPEPGYRDLTYQVNLKGTPPTVKFVKCDPAQPQIGQECTLSLCVEDFSPDALSVSWFREGLPILTGVFTSPPSLNPSGLFTQWAFLRLTPTPQDLGAVYTCRVGHSALAEPEERSYTLANMTLE